MRIEMHGANNATKMRFLCNIKYTYGLFGKSCNKNVTKSVHKLQQICVKKNNTNR